MLLHGRPPAGPKPHGTAALPPPAPFGDTDIGGRVTFVRIPFSVGSGAGVTVLDPGALEPGVSAGFSVRGEQATVTLPIPMIAAALRRREIRFISRTRRFCQTWREE